jgi:hypothetical protein
VRISDDARSDIAKTRCAIPTASSESSMTSVDAQLINGPMDQ